MWVGGCVWLGAEAGLGSQGCPVMLSLDWAVCAPYPGGSQGPHPPLYRGHFIIFSGGMPRASYGDRHCVSVLRADTLVTLDFTSRIIDFFTVHSMRPEDGVLPSPTWYSALSVAVLLTLPLSHRVRRAPGPGCAA